MALGCFGSFVQSSTDNAWSTICDFSSHRSQSKTCACVSGYDAIWRRRGINSILYLLKGVCHQVKNVDYLRGYVTVETHRIIICVERDINTWQEIPAAWTQEAYRLPCSKYCLYWSDSRGVPHPSSLIHPEGVPPSNPGVHSHTEIRVGERAGLIMANFLVRTSCDNLRWTNKK